MEDKELTIIRPVEEIMADIIAIKQQIANANSEERIDDMTIRYKTLAELNAILKALKDELKEAQGETTKIGVFGRRRGHGTWR